MRKGLNGAVPVFVQENSELKMADPIWLPLKYNSVFMLDKFSILVLLHCKKSAGVKWVKKPRVNNNTIIE